MSASEIDDYLDQLDEPKRSTLGGLTQTILDVVPDAEQCISYGLPACSRGDESPGRAAEPYLDAQRAAHLQRMRELTDLRRTGSVVDALLADHGLFHLEADLRWTDLTGARLDALAEAVRS